MSDAYDLGPPPERVEVDVAQVRRLVAAQLPAWADLPVAPVARGGWDNRTFRLGDDMVVRLPSAAEYAEAVPKEQRWLPVLSSVLPVAVPEPLALGAPGAGYPFAWSVYRWIEGIPLDQATVVDRAGLADDLAGVILALRAVNPADGPRPGVHNWFRGGPLRTYDDTARGALADLADSAGHVDVPRAEATWAELLAVPWDGVDRWFHGDLAAGNLLVDERGRLAALIDFGTCGVGDPACDLAVAWTVLTASGRDVLRARLDVDDDTWDRGRGWALWKALATARSCLDDPEDAGELADAVAVVEAVLGPP